MKDSIYIAGPMRSIPYYNFHAFDIARDFLLADGWKKVFSPADMDRAAGFDALKKEWPKDYNWSVIPEAFEFEKCIGRCIKVVRMCDAIYMLKGWENSKGAKAERAVAEWCGKKVLFEEEEEKPLLLEANELINGPRQAEYGAPNQDFKRTADMWTGLFQYKLKESERFRTEDVAWAMILLKASRGQHGRKRDNFLDAAGYSGCGWRCVQEKIKEEL